MDHATLNYILRDHDRARFEQRKATMAHIADALNAELGEGTVTLDMHDQYYNMRQQIEPVMHVIDIAKEAMLAAGVTPRVQAIRGGTDGAQLSFKGLPCPNIFAGGVNFHGPHEFVSIQVMEKAVRTIVRICEITGHYND